MLHSHLSFNRVFCTGDEKEIMDSFRAVRDLIKDYSRDFVEKNLS